MSYETIRHQLPELVGKKHVTIYKAENIVNQSNPDSIAWTKTANNYMKDVVSPGDDPTEPYSWMIAPIVSDMADYISRPQNETSSSNGTVVGVLVLLVYWRDLIRNILADDAEGIMCVFENACRQSFTYEIHGSDVKYLGPTDMHDSAFDGMKVSVQFDQLVNKSTTGRQYSGLPLGGELCPYTIHVYPTAKRRDYFTTQRPAT
jgi:hypothetical protein